MKVWHKSKFKDLAFFSYFGAVLLILLVIDFVGSSFAINTALKNVKELVFDGSFYTIFSIGILLTMIVILAGFGASVWFWNFLEDSSSY